MLCFGICVVAGLALLLIYSMLSVSAQQEDLSERWERELRDEQERVGQQVRGAA
ncbi:MAG: hypothetical protein JWN45_243 [Acidobacteriaceae bacterium]|nr:hypothetical protein [Acidobacteriaceae bacterium]